jgi:phosphate transport system permease protein
VSAEYEALLTPTARSRKLLANLVVAFAVVAAVVALVPLVSVAMYLVTQGAGVLRPEFLLEDPPGDLSAAGGGIRNAIVGTVMMTGVATAIAAPLGIMIGIFNTEIGGRIGAASRFLIDVLAAVPSIVIGIFVYSLVVVAQGHFSGFAGSVALAVIMLPVIVVSTEEMLRLIPRAMREGAQALGLKRWRTYLSIFIPNALSGIFTGLLLAISRAIGETAPLLFTALGNNFFTTDMNEPMQGMPLLIYRNALNSAFPAARDRAMGAALVLVVMVLAFNLLGRWLVARRQPARVGGR